MRRLLKKRTDFFQLDFWGSSWGEKAGEKKFDIKNRSAIR